VTLSCDLVSCGCSSDVDCPEKKGPTATLEHVLQVIHSLQLEGVMDYAHRRLQFIIGRLHCFDIWLKSLVGFG
jgi:hypothetical protein